MRIQFKRILILCLNLAFSSFIVNTELGGWVVPGSSFKKWFLFPQIFQVHMSCCYAKCFIPPGVFTWPVSWLPGWGKDAMPACQEDVRCVVSARQVRAVACMTAQRSPPLHSSTLWACSLTGHMALLLQCLITAAQPPRSFLTFLQEGSIVFDCPSGLILSQHDTC